VIVVGAGVLLMLSLSMLTPRSIRRAAFMLFTAGIGLLVYIALAGEEINGAKRWVRIAGFSLQPSEITKPPYVVLSAWAFAEYERRRDVPAFPIALGLYLTFVALLVIQPDIGQTLLVSLVWGAMFLLAGMPLTWAFGMAVIGALGLTAAYFALPYIRDRVHAFLDPVTGDNSQIERAYNSFKEGGFFGRGPGEGEIKTVLPDAHTDFIFAVIAEEYGIIACLAVLVLFMVIVFRALLLAISSDDLSIRYAVAGLALLIGGQAMINMGVNVGLLPAKGMTLPMISAGGSSLVATCITFGMMLGLARRYSYRREINLPDALAVDGAPMEARR